MGKEESKLQRVEVTMKHFRRGEKMVWGEVHKTSYMYKINGFAVSSRTAFRTSRTFGVSV